MNNKQQIALLIGIFVLVIIGFFPPWLHVQPGEAAAFMGNAPLWKPPVASHSDYAEFLGIRLQLDKSVYANEIDWSTLIAQASIVALSTTGVIIILGLNTQKKQDNPHSFGSNS